MVDSLFIASDDPLQPNLGIPVTAKVVSYFTTIDNEDSLRYREFGSWYYSTAQAYGGTSRYAWTTDGSKVYVRFATTLKKSGTYDIHMIVPKTANASTRAKYVLAVASVRIDSTVIDQNAGSGGWVTLFTKSLPQMTAIDVTVSDVSGTPVSGIVLRADALKFTLRQEATIVERESRSDVPETFLMQQNYPNPFNPTTRISYGVPRQSAVTLRVFDMLGREVAVLFKGVAEPGWYTVDFHANALSSGIYLCHLESGGFVKTTKMTLIR
jgi:hypothetical protein